MDFAGPFMQNFFMIVVDAKSKWLEVIPMKSITSYNTIRSLREIFARFGLPNVLVTDNGTNFTSKEFRDFLNSNGIIHKLTAPAHPSTNGQAERYVQTTKNALRSAINDGGDLHQKLQRFLMQNRKVPNCATGKSPAEVMLRHNLRTRIDLIKPSQKVNTYVGNHNNRQFRELSVGDLVQIRYYQNKTCKWIFGKITARDGLLHYHIDVGGQNFRRHIDQIRHTMVDPDPPNVSLNQPAINYQRITPSPSDIEKSSNDMNGTDEFAETGDDGVIDTTSSETQSPITHQSAEPLLDQSQIIQPHPRRSHRVRKAPVKLDL